jgi:hypothetical protein
MGPRFAGNGGEDATVALMVMATAVVAAVAVRGREGGTE